MTPTPQPLVSVCCKATYALKRVRDAMLDVCDACGQNCVLSIAPQKEPCSDCWRSHPPGEHTPIPKESTEDGEWWKKYAHMMSVDRIHTSSTLPRGIYSIVFSDDIPDLLAEAERCTLQNILEITGQIEYDVVSLFKDSAFTLGEDEKAYNKALEDVQKILKSRIQEMMKK